MGILNITPDSFAEVVPLVGPDATAVGPDVDRAVARALEMEAAGADMIDVGGESTRPGAAPVGAREEARRVLPVIEALTGRLRIPVSVDTYKGVVARDALSAGAVIVNDVSGLQYDPDLAGVAAAQGAALIVMHTRGRSASMYAEADYGNLVAEIAAELRESIALAVRAGMPADGVIVDPGIGFAKRQAHSYGVLARLPELAALVGRPLLTGPSRKSFMRDALDGRPPRERDWGTAAAVTAAVLGGSHVIRVHAVAEMVQVVRVAEQIRRHAEEPAGR